MAPGAAAAIVSTTASSSNIGNNLPTDYERDYESKYIANNLILKNMVSMALKAIIDLGLPDLLAKVEGRRPLSAEEILSQLPTKSTPGANSVSNLRRLLKPMVTEGVFSETFNDKKEPLYGLTKVSEYYIKDRQLTLQPHAVLHFTSPFLDMWEHLSDLILDENATPFEVYTGVPFYVYCQQNPEFAALFNDAMVGHAYTELGEVVDKLQKNGILEGVKTLVDVGGGREGIVVGRIVADNPQIRGINFDLPHVIDTAPEVEGVQHIAGSFFKSVPAGDAMLLKFVLHNHGDEDCTKILQNCFKALPKKGKVILAECLSNEYNDLSAKGGWVESVDLAMLVVLKGARERSAAEHEKLLKGVGFSQVSFFKSHTGMDLIQAFKEE